MLRKKVTLQTRGTSLDDYGQPSDDWTTDTNLGALVQSQTQTQANDNGRLDFIKTATFTFPRTTKTVTITNEDRISYDGSLYYIRSINTDKHNNVVVIGETI